MVIMKMMCANFFVPQISRTFDRNCFVSQVRIIVQKKKKKRVSDFYHNGSECAPYCAHEPVSSSSQKAKFFFILLAGAKMYCKDVKVSSSYMFLFACTYACVTAWGSRVV